MLILPSAGCLQGTASAVPVAVWTVPTVANLTIDFGVYGYNFINGIVIGNSSTGPTKTIGSADSFFSVRYS